jgi:hypothetical protein
LGERRVIPQYHAALRAAEGFSGGTRQHVRAFGQRVLKLLARDESGLMRSVINETSAPLGDDFRHLLDGQREERHRHAHHNQFWLNTARFFLKLIEVNIEGRFIKWNVIDFDAACSGGAIAAIAGMSTEGLRRAHDAFTGLGQRVINRHVADHTAHQTVIRIIAAKGLFQQFHTQRFDLINVLRARKPAIHAPDVPLRRARADFRGQQAAHSGAGGCFWRE